MTVVSVVIVTVVIVTVVIVTVVIVTLVIVNAVIDEMFEGQHFAILAMFSEVHKKLVYTLRRVMLWLKSVRNKKRHIQRILMLYQ